MEYGIGVAQNQTPIKQKKTKANWESLDEGVKLTATSREKNERQADGQKGGWGQRVYRWIPELKRAELVRSTHKN